MKTILLSIFLTLLVLSCSRENSSIKKAILKKETGKGNTAKNIDILTEVVDSDQEKVIYYKATIQSGETIQDSIRIYFTQDRIASEMD